MNLIFPGRNKTRSLNALFCKHIVSRNLPKLVYGDNVFKKTGINREGAGRHKKTRYFSGKQGIFSRDGPASGARIIGQVETGASAWSALFFCAQDGPGRAQERRQRGRAYPGPRSRESPVYQGLQGRRAAPPAPEVAAAADQRGRALRPMVRL